MSHPTIDQLQVLVAVADAGGFSAAGRRLNRAQSAISYAVAGLEAQVGLELFERSGTRVPVLTEDGRAMVADARQVLAALDALKSRAKGLRQGLEAEVALAIDVMFPANALSASLHAFQAEFPTVGLRLLVETLGGVGEMVQIGRADVGVSGPVARFDGMTLRQIGEIVLIPVAAPSHLLALAEGALSEEVLGNHTQLVLSDRSQVTEGEDFNVHSPHTWRLGDLGAKHTLLLAGLGWGSMPEPMVRADLAAGRLVRLHVAAWPTVHYWFTAVHRGGSPPGPAAAWLIERLSRDLVQEG